MPPVRKTQANIIGKINTFRMTIEIVARRRLICEFGIQTIDILFYIYNKSE